jgi:hypothetical protein
MCIIIDTNTFTKVFDHDNAEHPNFKPVYDWIIRNKGYLVIGGSKYKQELGLIKSSDGKRRLNASRILLELKIKNIKITNIDDEKVDKYQQSIQHKINSPDFDDPHIIALAVISKCKLICTSEIRALPFFSDKSLYPKNFKLPNTYRGTRDKQKLTTNCLNPCKELNRKQKK